MKGETHIAAIGEFVGLKSKMYSLQVDEKGVNRNVVGAISHNRYKEILLNNNFETFDEQNSKQRPQNWNL